jgi:CRISPR-associated protein Cas4
MKEYLANSLVWFVREVVSLESSLVILVCLIVIAVIVVDFLLSRIEESAKETGITQLGASTSTFDIEGTKSFPSKHYISEKQGLSGRPDAILIEDGFLIPVEHKPMAKKLRDRHVGQLLVYMRLIEEFEGKKPPYGYLILGNNSRKIKITNTDERQEWLSKLLNNMKNILNNTWEAKASPHPHKCSNCRVKTICSYRADPVNSSNPNNSAM